jgi:hypothetical protein
MKESYQKIYVVWQDPKSRKHFPVGELSYVHNEHEVYHFNYIYGVGESQKFGFQAFPGFPELDMTYVSIDLFPFFQNRILLPSREEYEAFVTSLGLSPSDAKPIDILARSGGRRATDSIEMFAPADIIETDDPDFNIAKYYFLLHGLSHMRDCAQVLAADTVKADNSLFVMHDIQNPVDSKALLLRTIDYCSIGFVPRYLLDDIWSLLDKQTDLRFYVYKVNSPPSPIQQRIVCKLEAKVQKDFISCRSEAYKAYKDFVQI